MAVAGIAGYVYLVSSSCARKLRKPVLGSLSKQVLPRYCRLMPRSGTRHKVFTLLPAPGRSSASKTATSVSRAIRHVSVSGCQASGYVDVWGCGVKLWQPF